MSPDYRYHSIKIDPEKCTGCVVCTMACPVQAIRVRNGKAMIKGNLCIDCGECMRVCPEQAVESQTTKREDLGEFKFVAALPSPVLYSQFGSNYTPNDILLALRRVGFQYVYDIALACEKVLAAIQIYLEENPEPHPMISNFCPPVTRMILKNYPDLIDLIIPIEVPREIAASLIRRKIVRERGVRPDEVGIFHITPCAAKMISIKNPVGIDKSNLDGAIGIQDLFVSIRKALKEEDMDDEWILQKSSGVGISWAIGKASIRGLPQATTLSVTGVADVVDILDQVEAGKLANVDYLELSMCPGGCVGGPLVVENRHLATSRIEDLIQQYGEKSRFSPVKVRQKYRTEYLLEKSKVVSHAPAPEPLDEDIEKALEKMNRMEELAEKLPGKNCGACGAPTCQALAEDIVLGEAELSHCVFWKIEELKHVIERHRAGNEPGDSE